MMITCRISISAMFLNTSCVFKVVILQPQLMHLHVVYGICHPKNQVLSLNSASDFQCEQLEFVSLWCKVRHRMMQKKSWSAVLLTYHQ